MRKKIDLHNLQNLSREDMLELAQQYEERRERRNARRRERRKWLKTAPREETALRYRAEERPCTVAQYLKAERFVLRWLDEFPDLKGDGTAILLVLTHNILHILQPEKACTGTTLTGCPSFSIHDFCDTGIEIALHFNPDPAFKLTHAQIFEAMVTLTQGVDKERLDFDVLLGDISIDL